jgi:thermitase
LHPNVNPNDVDQILAEDDLRIVYRFGFAPHTFEVSLPTDRPALDVIAQLQDKLGKYVFVEPSLLQPITPRFTPTDPRFHDQWQHQDQSVNVNAAAGICSERAWDVTRGKDKNGRAVRIAIIDNGMQISHPDLRDGVIGCARFDLDQFGHITFKKILPGGTGFPETKDHGTFCMGMAGARMSKGNEVGQGGCGSAPESALIALAVAPGMVGTQNALARAIHYAADPSFEDNSADPKDGADVISCSLKTAQLDFSTLKGEIEFAAQHGRSGLGVPILWAVSNDSVSIETDKVCSNPDVVAVGRSNQDGLPAGSAFGDKLAFLAPGEAVFSTRSEGQYDIDRGTSFATPLAAGVAALILACHPEFTAAQVRQKLVDSCDQITGVLGHNTQTGNGILNASRAVVD